MQEHSRSTAGIDVSKRRLDVAIDGAPERLRFVNDPDGRRALAAELARRGVARAGLEASGGYERAVAAELRAAGIEVVLLQPLQVRAYARYRLRRAKTDAIDAGLIAACAAASGPARAAPDARLASAAERLRLIEQIEDDAARLKTRIEAYADPALRERLAEEVRRLKAWRAEELGRLAAELRDAPDLARRLDLLVSVPGIGERTALTLLIRMPEIASLSREQAASLAGLAPFDRSSGTTDRTRHIAGGRAQLRTALYAAALPAAFRWNPALMAFYARLKAAGKTHKKALVACARKLLTYAVAVVQRDAPWRPA